MFSAAGKTAAVATAANYIEDVFSTWLYTGNGSTQTITNGIDLSTKGGLVWVKDRSGAYAHVLVDTARGTDKVLCSNNTNAEQTGDPGFVTQFNTNGFAVGNQARVNLSSSNVASWTFRKQPKFFDVVTYTGDGTSNRKINHSLGVMPAVIIVKRTDSSSNWSVYHHGAAGGGGSGQNTYRLNTTEAANNLFTVDRSSSTQFSVYATADLDSCNTNGGTYVAYLFASNAGGFGLTGTDNVITCGSYTGNGSSTGPVINLGYEPQWLLIKRATTSGSGWLLIDSMRGMPVGSADVFLVPNSSQAEDSFEILSPTATGFQIANSGPSVNFSGDTYIYIAIRRGPMKTPTTGTSVFTPVVYTGNSSTNTVTSGFPVDLSITKNKDSNGPKITVIDRMRGFGTSTDATKYLFTSATDAEGGASDGVTGMGNTGLTLSSWSQTNFSSSVYIDWMFQRAPGFFDEVCYTGTTSEGTPITVSHNLNAVPELIITKKRSQAASWFTYHAALTAANYVSLDSSNASAAYSNMWNNTTPTSTVFTTAYQNASGDTYVAYLFASCPGVSKVGSYTGSGTTKQIDCGFTGGARFVLIKRTDSTGDWYVWDSARGIVSGNDPYLLLNSTAAEVTNTDYVDTYSAGFEISSTAPAAINANGGTFVFLAVA